MIENNELTCQNTSNYCHKSVKLYKRQQIKENVTKIWAKTNIQMEF